MLLNKVGIEKSDLEYIHTKARKEMEILSGNSLLFTGANGFIGYYFIKSILAWNTSYPNKKIRLYALDNFSTGVSRWIKGSDLKVLRKDMVQYKLPVNKCFDYIVHAASIASPVFYRKYPIETINVNVWGLYNIIEYMLKRQKTKGQVKGLLFFSSSEIYGDPTEANIPTPETYRGNVSCTGPRSCYDEAKRFCETLCVNFSRVHNLPIKIARPFNNYGPGLRLTDGRVISDFANDILHNKNVTMLSQGSPTRTFCYIADAIVGYIKILAKGKPAESYNIGVEEPEISVHDLAYKMVELATEYFGYSGKVVMKKNRDDNYLVDSPMRRSPQIHKARKHLGYKPEISLDEGLTKTIFWYKQRLRPSS